MVPSTDAAAAHDAAGAAGAVSIRVELLDAPDRSEALLVRPDGYVWSTAPAAEGRRIAVLPSELGGLGAVSGQPASR